MVTRCDHGYLSFPVVPSNYDERDIIFENLQQTKTRLTSIGTEIMTEAKTTKKKQLLFPDELDLRNKLLSVRHQGTKTTCIAFCCATLLEFRNNIDSDFCEYLSPSSIYYFRYKGNNYKQNCRDFMKLLNKRGLISERFFPYDPVNHPKKFPENVLKSEHLYTINNYAKVLTIDGLQESLYNYGPALIAFPVYNNFPQFWRKTSSKPLGGHSAVVVGYIKEGFIIRNSWGHTWGAQGYVIYPYEDWGSHWEIWTCIDNLPNINNVKSCFFPFCK